MAKLTKACGWQNLFRKLVEKYL